MITIGYPPEQVGGTEVYVAGLVEALRQQGHSCAVAYVQAVDDPAAPDIHLVTRTHEETPVHIIQVNALTQKLEFLIFDPQLRARLIAAFRDVVDSQVALKTAQELADLRAEAAKKATDPATLMTASKAAMLANVDLVKADLAYRQAYVQLMSLIGKQ